MHSHTVHFFMSRINEIDIIVKCVALVLTHSNIHIFLLVKPAKSLTSIDDSPVDGIDGKVARTSVGCSCVGDHCLSLILEKGARCFCLDQSKFYGTIFFILNGAIVLQASMDLCCTYEILFNPLYINGNLRD